MHLSTSYHGGRFTTQKNDSSNPSNSQSVVQLSSRKTIAHSLRGAFTAVLNPSNTRLPLCGSQLASDVRLLKRAGEHCEVDERKNIRCQRLSFEKQHAPVLLRLDSAGVELDGGTDFSSRRWYGLNNIEVSGSVTSVAPTSVSSTQRFWSNFTARSTDVAVSGHITEWSTNHEKLVSTQMTTELEIHAVEHQNNFQQMLSSIAYMKLGHESPVCNLSECRDVTDPGSRLISMFEATHINYVLDEKHSDAASAEHVNIPPKVGKNLQHVVCSASFCSSVLHPTQCQNHKISVIQSSEPASPLNISDSGNIDPLPISKSVNKATSTAIISVHSLEDEPHDSCPRLATWLETSNDYDKIQSGSGLTINKSAGITSSIADERNYELELSNQQDSGVFSMSIYHDDSDDDNDDDVNWVDMCENQDTNHCAEADNTAHPRCRFSRVEFKRRSLVSNRLQNILVRNRKLPRFGQALSCCWRIHRRQCRCINTLTGTGLKCSKTYHAWRAAHYHLQTSRPKWIRGLCAPSNIAPKNDGSQQSQDIDFGQFACYSNTDNANRLHNNIRNDSESSGDSLSNAECCTEYSLHSNPNKRKISRGREFSTVDPCQIVSRSQFVCPLSLSETSDESSDYGDDFLCCDFEKTSPLATQVVMSLAAPKALSPCSCCFAVQHSSNNSPFYSHSNSRSAEVFTSGSNPVKFSCIVQREEGSPEVSHDNLQANSNDDQHFVRCREISDSLLLQGMNFEDGDDDVLCRALHLNRINRSWFESYSAAPRLTNKSSKSLVNRKSDELVAKVEKKVSFCDAALSFVPILNDVLWSDAYTSARIGPWTQMGLDCERFRRRINDLDSVISTILLPDHRYNVLMTRFQQQDQ